VYEDHNLRALGLLQQKIMVWLGEIKPFGLNLWNIGRDSTERRMLPVYVKGDKCHCKPENASLSADVCTQRG